MIHLMKIRFRFSVCAFVLAGFSLLSAPSYAQDAISPEELPTSQLLRQTRELLENRKATEVIPYLEEVMVRLGVLEEENAKEACLTAHYQLGLCRMEAGEYEAAAEAFRSFVQTYPGHESALEARFLAMEALAWLKDPEPVQSYIAELEQSGEFDRLLPVLREQTDATRHVVISLVSAYAQSADFENVQRFLPFCDEDARSDIGLNLALMDGGDLAVDNEDYRSALWFYREVRLSTELIASCDRRLAALHEEIQAPLPWVPISLREAQAAQRAAETNRYAQIERERERLEIQNYDLDLMMRMARCYDGMQRRWNACVIYQHIYTAFPESRFAERCRYSAFQCLTALEELDDAEQAGDLYLEMYPAGRYRDAITLGLMQILLQRDHLPAACEFGQELRRQEPAHRYLDQVTYLLGYVQYARQDYEAALALFRETRETWPERLYAEESVYWEGMCLLFLSRFDEAVAVFEGYLHSTEWQSKEFEADVTFRLGMARYGLEEYEACKEIFRKFLVRFPDDELCSEACSMLGDLYGADGEMEPALRYYGRARDCAVTAEQESYAVFQAAQVFELQGRHMKLIAWLQDYLDERGAEGDFVPATLRISRAWRALGKGEQALDAECAAVLRYGNIPDSEDADLLFVDLRDAVTQRGGVSAGEVLRRLSAAREKIAGDVTQKTLFLRLTALFAGISEDPSEYIEQLLGEKTLDAFSPLPLRLVAEAAAARGETDRVRQALDLFLEKYARADGLLEMSDVQIRLLMAAGRLEEALALAEEVLATGPEGTAAGRICLLTADVLRMLKLYERSMAMYNKFLEVRAWRGPLTPQALYWTGICCLELGNIEEACAWFQRVYVLYGQYPEWTARAYAASADGLNILGRRDDAIRTLREMVADPNVAATEEGLRARAELDALQKEVP